MIKQIVELKASNIRDNNEGKVKFMDRLGADLVSKEDGNSFFNVVEAW